MARLKVSLPDKIIKKYHLQAGDRFNLIVKNGEIKVEKQNIDRVKRQFNVIGLILTSIIASVAFAIYVDMVVKLRQLPLVGSQSIASGLIVLGAISGMLMFSTYFILNRKNITTNYSAYTYWRTFPVIVISFTLILVIALMGIAWGMGQIFAGVTFGHGTAFMLFFVFDTAINYLMVRFGLAVNYELLTTVLILVIISGAIFSMASNRKDWWQHNLSFLGTQQANNSWQFNLTLVFSSLMMIALIDYIFVSLRDVMKSTWRLKLLHLLLILTAVDMGAVGVFPNNANFHDLHDHVATYLVYFILALIVGIRWLLPEVGQRFLWISYACGIGLIVIDVMFKPLNLISLTAFELMAFVLAFGWILILFDTMIGIVQEHGEGCLIKIEKDDSHGPCE